MEIGFQMLVVVVDTGVVIPGCINVSFAPIVMIDCGDDT